MSDPIRPDYHKLPSNTKKDKEAVTTEPEKKELKKVISGTAVKRKKSVGRRFKEVFFEDNADRVGEFLLMDVIIPGTKDLLLNLGNTFLEQILYGRVQPRSVVQRGGLLGSLGRNNYQPQVRSQNRGGTSQVVQLSDQGRRMHDFSEIVIPDRGSAELVLVELQQQIDAYKVATVADLYNLVGITENFVDNEWGWYSLEGANARRVRNGFVLNLPPTEQLTR